MTRRPAIKPEDIQLTYNRSPKPRDLIVKAEVYKLPQSLANHVKNPYVRPAHT